MADMSAEYASETKGPKIVGVFWAFFAMSVMMVGARLFIRARMLKNIGLDDYIIATAMVRLLAHKGSILSNRISNFARSCLRVIPFLLLKSFT